MDSASNARKAAAAYGRRLLPLARGSLPIPTPVSPVARLIIIGSALTIQAATPITPTRPVLRRCKPRQPHFHAGKGRFRSVGPAGRFERAGPKDTQQTSRQFHQLGFSGRQDRKSVV